MARKLPSDKQELLLILLNCGFQPSQIALKAKIAKATVTNHKRRLIHEGKITNENVPLKEALRKLFQSWVIHLPNRTITSVIEHEFIAPFLERLSDSVSAVAWVFEPQNPFEQLWVKIVEPPTLNEFIWGCFRKTVIEDKTDDPDAIYQIIVDKFRSGEALPYWPGRVEALKAALDQLQEVERLIIVHKYGLLGEQPKTIQKIKQALKDHGYFWYSEDRIRGTRDRAVARLKHILGREYLDEGRILTSLADLVKKSEDQQRHRQLLEAVIDNQRKQIVELDLRLVHIRVSEENRLQEVERARVEKLSELRISDLDISVRAYNCLTNNSIYSIYTVGDLIQKTEKDLLSIRNFGKRCLLDVKNELTKLNLSLKEIPAEEELEELDEDEDLPSWQLYETEDDQLDNN